MLFIVHSHPPLWVAWTIRALYQILSHLKCLKYFMSSVSRLCCKEKAGSFRGYAVKSKKKRKRILKRGLLKRRDAGKFSHCSYASTKAKSSLVFKCHNLKFMYIYISIYMCICIRIFGHITKGSQIHHSPSSLIFVTQSPPNSK